ncbi:MAG: hypothetical protein GXZ02_00135 [Clostridiales bacterium]|nr:hypothetical protein [Clostridiales bacterium]
MERTGIHSERGDINRNIFKHNAFLEQAKTMYEEAVAKVEKLKTAKPIVIIRNEVLDLIAKVVGKKGRLDLPIMKGEFISKISKRENLQSEQFMTAFVTKNNISTFEELNSFIKENKEKYSQISKERKNDFAEVERLEELQNLYAEFLPYKKIKAKSKSLKGFEKIRYDKDHKSDFEQYKITREALYSNLKDGAKPTPKVWSTDISKHNTSLETTRTKYSKVVTELAYSEVLEYNRKNLEREQQNDRHQPSQNRKKEHDI